MNEGEHPCGALPVYGWYLNVWYCPAHQAWWATSRLQVEIDADGGVRSLRDVSTTFGPFDTSIDVRAWAKMEATAIDRIKQHSERTGE